MTSVVDRATAQRADRASLGDHFQPVLFAIARIMPRWRHKAHSWHAVIGIDDFALRIDDQRLGEYPDHMSESSS